MDDFWGEEPDWTQEGPTEQQDGDDGNGVANIPNAQHVLILLDCAKANFTTTVPDPEFPDETIPLMDWSLTLILQAIRSKIRTVTIQKTGKRDGIGILLYNTKRREPLAQDDEEEDVKSSPMKKTDPDDDDNEEDYYGDQMYSRGSDLTTTVHTLLPMDPPGVSSVQKLKSTQADLFTGDRDLDLQKEYCDQEEVEEEGSNRTESVATNLQAGLHEALQAFRKADCVKQRPTKYEVPDTKQIWIVTSNDDPSGGDDDHFRILQNSVTNISDSQVELFVWPLLSSFDASKFYGKISEADVIGHEDLLETLESQFKKTRRAYSVPLLLPNYKTSTSDYMKLDMFKLTQTSREPTKVPVHQETGKRLYKIRQFVLKHGGEILAEYRNFGPKEQAKTTNDDRIQSFVEFGGEKVLMSPKDKAEIKKNSNIVDFASLLLLGFKPSSSILFYHCVEHSYLAYPNEEECKGSNEAFAALHASMLRKKVVGIGELLTRASATSRLVVLRAVQEQVDEEGRAVRPSGILITGIPFEDEIRSIDKDVAERTLEEKGVNLASDNLIEAAMELVRKQTFVDAEIGVDFENPYLSRLWNYVEHVALGEPMTKDKEFDTEVNKEAVLKHCGEQIERFNSLLPEDIVPEKPSRKRELQPDDTGIDWLGLFTEGNLESCKVPELKSKLRSLGETLSGNKSVLIERVSKHLEEELKSTSVKTEPEPSIKEEPMEAIKEEYND